LFGIVGGGFMKMFGANALFLAPEYLGNVSILSATFVGLASGVFLMSWNITTFILHSKYFKFLAATKYPFLKYCLNNSLMPVIFLLYYLYHAVDFCIYRELLPLSKVLLLIAGFLLGFILLVMVSLLYFFGADRQIIRKMQAIKNEEDEPLEEEQKIKYWFRVKHYLVTPFKARPCRSITHYDPELINSIFNRHHLTGMILVFVAFLLLVFLGFVLDNEIFQIPAAASITLLLASLVAVIGGLSYFLKSWAVPFIIALYTLANMLYTSGVIDPRNKAYGINYDHKNERPAYNKETVESICSPQYKQQDVANMLQILDAWKQKQLVEKPQLVIVNVSGGGLRSSNFTTQILTKLDSEIPHGIFPKTFLISGASGGMLGAAYCREVYRKKVHGQFVDANANKMVDNISKDLLNPLISSYVIRDVVAPVQKFGFANRKYTKDRAYAFEEKLNNNVNGILGDSIGAYANDERTAKIPLMIYGGTITRDNRKLLISTQKLSFAMQPWQHDSLAYFVPPDAVDYQRLFEKQSPNALRLLSALRINATFPYALPNVWLPTNPVIDVMDAGLRDNYGTDVTLRILMNCKKWILENTSGVTIIQIRDRENTGEWNYPLEGGDISELFTKPMMQLQYNMFKVQQYGQNNELSNFIQWSGIPLKVFSFQYTPSNKTNRASLSFHLTPSERKDISAAVLNKHNTNQLQHLRGHLAY
jgi:hypothetical protein